MDFTREPIIQTVITPKEGCKIVVRSSKNSAQEEYFVDAIEVVSFGTAIFFRSLERPKSFLVPASDYEILEVREARMVLKNVGVDRAIKIGGGRDAAVRSVKEQTHERHESPSEPLETSEESVKAESKADERLDKKRDRRRNSRRRRGREDAPAKDGEAEDVLEPGEKSEVTGSVAEGTNTAESLPTTSVLTSLLPPPSKLISETIAHYRENAVFKGAFYSKEEPLAGVNPEGAILEEDSPAALDEEESSALPTILLPQPEYGSFEMAEEDEEEIYRLRRQAAENLKPDEASQEEDDNETAHEKEEAARENETAHEEEKEEAAHVESSIDKETESAEAVKEDLKEP